MSFHTTGALPTGLTDGQRYQVKTVIDPNSFTVYNPQSSTTAINFTGSQSGVQTAVGSGIITYVNSALYTNTLRWASKFSTVLKDFTIDNYDNFTSAGGDFPSHLFFSGTSGNPNDRASTIGTGQVWGAWDPSIYGDEAGYWQAFVEFNN